MKPFRTVFGPVFCTLLLCFMIVTPPAVAQDLCAPVGWATQNGGVTGGGNASPSTASTYDQLKSLLTSSSAKVVYVSGVITIPAGGRITIQDQSGKTIFGLPGSKIVSTDKSASGSGIFYFKRCTNFIMRNITLEGPGAYDTDGYDNMCIDNCQNFWVDHCEFHDGMDGNFDIKNASDFISVTWSTFSYEKPPIPGGSGGSNDHRYSNLIGSSDGATGDQGKLNVTFYYCWWGEGCRERMPRMRYGKLHMVNSLFSSSVSNQCIRAGYKADVLAEGNYFDNQKLPIDEYEKNYTAIKGVRNYGASDIIKNTAFTPPYTIAVADAQSIVTPIKSCAGATLTSMTTCSPCGGGDLNQLPSVSITAPANNAFFNAPAEVSITAAASDPDGSVAKVEFYSGSTLLGSDNSAPYSYSWTNVTAGTYSVTAKVIDNKGASAVSDPVTVKVNDPSIPSLSSTENLTQSVVQGSAINPIVFTWGGAATDVNYTTLPAGLSGVKSTSAKTLTVSGTPSANGSFSVSTVGGSSSVTLNASITVKDPGSTTVLADWYPFQENPVSLKFVTFADASLDNSYFDQTKPDNGVTYTPGALRLNKGTGTMTITLKSLEVLKIRWYATGGRTLKVTYGTNGNENSWESSVQYESGAHELDLTDLIPGLVSAIPLKVNIINNRADGGSFNIHDLYVEGSADMQSTAAYSFKSFTSDNHFKATVSGQMLTISASESMKSQNIMILNAMGRTIYSGACSRSLDISRFNKGVYFLKIGDHTRKFFKR